jgi:uncharacterized membrane protein YbhN (UPF0104 family)
MRSRRSFVWVPVTGGLVVVVVWRSRVWEAPAELQGVQQGLVALALTLNAAVVALWGLRSWMLLRAAGERVPLRGLLPLGALAFTVNSVTPGSTGELVRAYLLKVRYGVGYSTGGAVILFERFGALVYMAATAGSCWVVTRMGFSLPSVVIAIGLLGGAACMPFLGVRLARVGLLLPGHRLVGTQRWLRLHDGMSRMAAALAALALRPRTALAFFVASLATFAVFTAQLWLIIGAIGQSLDPVSTWGALGLSMVAGVLSLLPFGLGATDIVLAAFLGIAGVTPMGAGLAVLAFRLTSTLPLAVSGALSYAIMTADVSGAPWSAHRESQR